MLKYKFHLFLKTFFSNHFDLVAIRIFDEIIIRWISRQPFWFSHFIALSSMLSVQTFQIRRAKSNMSKAITDYIRSVVIIISQFKLIIISIQTEINNGKSVLWKVLAT